MKSSKRNQEGAIARVARDLRLIASSQVEIWALYDGLIGIGATLLGFKLSPSFFEDAPWSKDISPLFVGVIYGAAFVVTALIMGLYDRQTFLARRTTLLRVCMASPAAWGLTLAVHYAVFFQPVGRWIVVISGIVTALGCLLPRILLAFLSYRSMERILLVGTSKAKKIIYKSQSKQKGHHFLIVRTISPRTLLAATTRSRLVDICQKQKADLVVVEDLRANRIVDQTLECLRKGIRVSDLSSFIETVYKKVPLEYIDLAWSISANLRQTRPLSAMLKRGCDICLSLVGLLVTLPLWPLIAILVRSTSRGPVIYSQLRVGQADINFTLFKFRTMNTNAEADGKARWASRNDPRVTLAGKFLRKFRLDEIPQFINILKGEMSLVGPRPERPAFVKLLTKKIPHYPLRHLVRPGVSGWAQIMYPYGASVEDAFQKQQHDLYYIKHGNILFDFVIVLRTLGSLVKGSR